MKSKIINYLMKDIKFINKYLLVVSILLILTVVGTSSYALFTYETYSPSSIHVVFKDVEGPKCVVTGPNETEISGNTNATYEMNCTDGLGVVEKNLSITDFIITGDISLSNVTKEAIENGYKYIITILSGTTDTTGNIKLKSNVLQDSIGNYNSESNISNNIIVNIYDKFYIKNNNVNQEYKFFEDTTWENFINSNLNEEIFGISGNNVYYLSSNVEVRLNGNAVLKTEKIIKNTEYTTFEWASESLIVYDGTLDTTRFGMIQAVLNNGYFDKNLTNNKSSSLGNDHSFTLEDDSMGVYIADVTKYKTLYMTYKNLNSASDSDAYKDFGIVKDSKIDTQTGSLSSEDGDFEVYKKLSGKGTTEKTVSLDISNLTGMKRVAMNSQFVFSGGEWTGIYVYKMWLE